MTTFLYRADAGHGWLIVSKEWLQRVGLSEADITPFSYHRPDADQVALEEDLDAQTFLDAYKAKIGTMPDIADQMDGSSIRNWPGFGTRPIT